MTQLVRYEAMRNAISVCHSVDEIKDLHDKALALELYTKQAQNLEAERKAADIRIRAERRAGELLRDLARTTVSERAVLAGQAGGRPSQQKLASKAGTQVIAPSKAGRAHAPKRVASPYSETLSRTGLSKQTASRWQQLADIPEKDFEQALADPSSKPSTTRLIKQIRDPVPQLEAQSLRVWGLCTEYERELAKLDLVTAVAGMPPYMRADAGRIVPNIVNFYQTLQQELRK